MPQLQNEIDANHVVFFKDWTAQAVKNWKTLQSNSAYQASYRRLSVRLIMIAFDFKLLRVAG
jgi:hypothetical protein